MNKTTLIHPFEINWKLKQKSSHIYSSSDVLNDLLYYILYQYGILAMMMWHGTFNKTTFKYANYKSRYASTYTSIFCQ